jgi:hypothetical protein
MKRKDLLRKGTVQRTLREREEEIAHFLPKNPCSQEEYAKFCRYLSAHMFQIDMDMQYNYDLYKKAFSKHPKLLPVLDKVFASFLRTRAVFKKEMKDNIPSKFREKYSDEDKQGGVASNLEDDLS